MKFRTYFALGDALTSTSAHWMSWEERLSLILRGDAEFSSRHFTFKNLVEPRAESQTTLSRKILEALTYRADLVSITIGINSLLITDSQNPSVPNALTDGIAGLRSHGTTVLITNRLDPPSTLVSDAQRTLTAERNANIWRIAREQQSVVLDLWGTRELRETRMWDHDLKGLSDSGCRLLARHASHTLGVPYAETISR